MLAVAVTKLSGGAAWSYELKFDGYRAIAVKEADQVRLFSRNGKAVTRRFASIAQTLEALPDETVIDGEIIDDADGRPSFNVLQNYRDAFETPLLRLRPADTRGRVSDAGTAG
jgi:bifunctional non-homologous end joining protein LigD